MQIKIVILGLIRSIGLAFFCIRNTSFVHSDFYSDFWPLLSILKTVSIEIGLNVKLQKSKCKIQAFRAQSHR